ncbi:hypothetical protein GCM10009847_04450 [Leucobacter tardus]
MLRGFLDYLRQSIAHKIETAPEPAVRTAQVPSGTTLLGLLNHLAHVEEASTRWALTHMIEETGRHAGHADILRELIDGATGR